jgi:hypothetical protein
MKRRVTVVALGNCGVQNYSGDQPSNPDTPFTSVSFRAGNTYQFDLSESQWDAVRRDLVKLSQMRMTYVENGVSTSRTQPIMTYSVDFLPGFRVRINQVEGSPISLAAPANVTLRGVGLIAGTQAGLTINPGTTSSLALTATRKGPQGNKVVVAIKAASGAGSVTTTFGLDGAVTVTVVPAAAGDNANAIAAQINANVTAALFVTAVGGGVGLVRPIEPLRLTGGDGAGVAFVDLFYGATGRLRLEAVKPGNEQNLITITFNTPAGLGSVVVSGNNITVTPAAAGAAIATVATQINTDPAASALVTASATGAGNVVATGKTYLANGSGETPVVTIGGAATTVVSHSDTALVLSTTNGALVAAGVAAGEIAMINVLTNYGNVQAPIDVVA